MQQLESLNQAIIEFYEKLSSWEHAVVKGHSLTLSQIHTVEVLGAYGAMRMKELADKLAITTGTLTVQVDKLVGAGIITRYAHENDRRSILVDLTEQGQQVYQQHEALHLALTQDITANLDDEQKADLLQAISSMNQAF